MSDSAVPARRRIEAPENPDTKGRKGCLIWGAVLGVVVGATFAFYGLPPILRHFYGEARVAADASFTGDGKLIRVLNVASEPPGLPSGAAAGEPASYYITLTLTTARPWTPKASDFSLELDGVGAWVVGVASRGASADGAIPLTTGVATEVTIRFQRPVEANARPSYVHLASPRVRFELPR